jgi:hypothetical protein
MKFIPANLVETVKSSSFIEKALLLLATGGLTGVLVPEISARMASDRSREQLIFQTDLARQDKIIEAQAAFYDRFADLIWEFHLLHINVSFRRLLAADAKYQAAVDSYTARSAELLGRIRAEISKGGRLMGPRGAQVLLEFYNARLLSQDMQLEKLILSPGEESLPDWRRHHQAVLVDSAAAIDQTLAVLAAEMSLQARTAK